MRGFAAIELNRDPVSDATTMLHFEVDETVEMLTSSLDKIAEHGKRADGIVRSMLEHSHGVAGERRAVDLNALLDEAPNLAYHGAGAQDRGFDITMERDLEPGCNWRRSCRRIRSAFSSI